MGEPDIGWGISVDTLLDGQWSFGVCFSHFMDETYIFINFFKWSISIGKISKG